MAIIKLRRGPASEWTEVNPTLASGEVGVELDTYRFKIGTGLAPWNALAYFSPDTGSGHEIQDEGVPVINRSSLNFVGDNVSVVDDADNNKTNVVISGGGGAATIVAPEPPDPTGLPEGTLWVDEDSTGPAGGGGGGGYVRATATKTTASLAANATESSDITLAAGYKLYRITTSAPCRFRMYTEAAKRTADLTRAIGVDPSGDHGLQFEFVATNPDLTFDLTPLVDGFDGKTTPDGVIPCSITNMTAGATPITVDLLWIRTE